MNCGSSGFLSIGHDILHSKPLLQYIPDLALLYVLQMWESSSIGTSCVCGIGRLSQFWSGQTGKTFSLYSLCCLVPGKRGCSNLHCFACWLMCLWERCAWCEVNSCALQYHYIPFFSFLFPPFQCVILCCKGKARTKQLCRMWCHYLHCDKLSIQSRSVSSVINLKGTWTVLIYKTGKWGSNLLSGNHPAPACIE